MQQCPSAPNVLHRTLRQVISPNHPCCFLSCLDEDTTPSVIHTIVPKPLSAKQTVHRVPSNNSSAFPRKPCVKLTNTDSDDRFDSKNTTRYANRLLDTNETDTTPCMQNAQTLPHDLIDSFNPILMWLPSCWTPIRHFPVPTHLGWEDSPSLALN